MKERPIIMQAESVRAILDGRKTQTRRVLKHQAGTPMPTKDAGIWGNNCDPVTTYFGCPHGQPGDRLWVKDAWGHSCLSHGGNSPGKNVIYKADGCLPCSTWKSPLFMPRWASRITLELVNVRVERVQDISEADAECEGVETATPQEATGARHRYAYRRVWESIHSKNPARRWEANPWVWVLEFKRINP